MLKTWKQEDQINCSLSNVKKGLIRLRSCAGSIPLSISTFFDSTSKLRPTGYDPSIILKCIENFYLNASSENDSLNISITNT